MRTTIDLPEDLLAAAKQLAAKEGRTLSAVVSDAVRVSLARSQEVRRTPVKLPTGGRGGLQPGIDLDDSAALLDLMELDDN